MTQEEITSFLTVVKAGSLSAAANLLYITHPALSHRIHTLEEKLGYPLFVRRPGFRKVVLTPKGEIFVSIAEQWNALANKAYELRRSETVGKLSIASIESISFFMMPIVCKRLAKEFPDLRLSVKLQYSINTYTDMLNRTVDFGIINNTQYVKELHCQPAFQEKMVFVCRKDSNYPKTVDPTILTAKDCILVPWSIDFEVWYQYWFHNSDDCRLFLQNSSILSSCFNSQQNWSVVPALVGNWLQTFPQFEIHDIHNGPTSRMNYFLTHRNESSPYINSVYNILRESLSSLDGVDVLF